jgi:tetratricopeptide (TPR) repeat protein
MSTSLKTSAAATFLLLVGLGSGVSLAQNVSRKDLSGSPNQINSGKRVSAQQSMVDARLTSDQMEEGKIKEVYQEVVRIHLRGDYGEAANEYRSVVIPMAEKTQSPATRRKFLFLGYRGLGNCYLGMSRFTEAEETFQKLFEYLPMRPGMQDSDYAINFESIAMARMGEQRWEAAEESLGKAVAIFDQQIVRAVAAGADSAQDEHANQLRMSQDIALNLFAVVYFREQRYTESLEALERAYQQGITFRAPSEVVSQIVNDGRAVSMAAGDPDAVAVWSQRTSEAQN